MSKSYEEINKIKEMINSLRKDYNKINQIEQKFQKLKEIDAQEIKLISLLEKMLNEKLSKNDNKLKKESNDSDEEIEHHKKILAETFSSQEEKKFVEYCRQVMDIEEELEKFKQELATKPDFSQKLMWKLFNEENKKNIQECDVGNFLKNFGISDPDGKKCGLLMDRIDLKKEGIVEFSDFVNFITPLDEKLKRIVKDKYEYSKLSDSTKLKFCEYLNLIIKYELEIENAKKVFLDFDEDDLKFHVFNKIDSKKKNYIKIDDWLNYINKFIYSTDTEKQKLMFYRFNPGKKDKIIFEDILEELKE